LEYLGGRLQTAFEAWEGQQLALPPRGTSGCRHFNVASSPFASTRPSTVRDLPNFPSHSISQRSTLNSAQSLGTNKSCLHSARECTLASHTLSSARHPCPALLKTSTAALLYSSTRPNGHPWPSETSGAVCHSSIVVAVRRILCDHRWTSTSILWPQTRSRCVSHLSCGTILCRHHYPGHSLVGLPGIHQHQGVSRCSSLGVEQSCNT